MTNKDLIWLIEKGHATDGQKERYMERVTLRVRPDHCRYGHEDCALVPGGPCSSEVFASQSDAHHAKHGF